MSEHSEQFLIRGGSTPTEPALGLRLDPPLATSDWVLVCGSTTAPRPTTGRGWILGRWRSRPARQILATTLHVRLPGSDEPRPVPLGPDGEFEARFAVNLPRLRGTTRQVHFTLEQGSQRVERSAPLFMPAPGATLGLIVLAANTSATNQPAGIGLSEASRELARLISSPAGQAGGNPVFYLGLASNGRMAAGNWREPGWPDGLSVRAAEVTPARAAVELAVWIERLAQLYARELEFVIIGDTAPHVLAVLRAAARRKLSADRLRAVLLSDARPVARGVLRQSEMPDGLRDLELPIVLCRTLDDARRTAAACGLVQSSAHEAGQTNSPGQRASLARARTTRYPLVFCHGMVGYSVLRMHRVDLVNYFNGLREFLSDRGFRLLMPEVGQTHGIAQRAEQLRQAIGRWTSEPVHIIGHSMGGLDARYMISKLDMAGRVVSLTTVATPHHGTYIADWFVERFDSKLPLLRSLEQFGMDVDGFRDVTRAACREFNKQVPDSPQVRYTSYSAFQVPRKIPPVLRRSHSLIAGVEGANDGLVSETSARWGEHQATLRSDHLALVGECVREYFDHLAFYLRIVEDLVRMGL